MGAGARVPPRGTDVEAEDVGEEDEETEVVMMTCNCNNDNARRQMPRTRMEHSRWKTRVEGICGWKPVDDTARRLGALASDGVHNGFVKDDFARMCAPVQGKPFLSTGSRPKVGQRLEIQMSVEAADVSEETQGQMTWFRLSGLATFVEGRGVTRGLGVPCPDLPCGCGDLKHEAEFGARHFTKVGPH